MSVEIPRIEVKSGDQITVTGKLVMGDATRKQWSQCKDRFFAFYLGGQGVLEYYFSERGKLLTPEQYQALYDRRKKEADLITIEWENAVATVLPKEQPATAPLLVLEPSSLTGELRKINEKSFENQALKKAKDALNMGLGDLKTAAIIFIVVFAAALGFRR